MKLGAWTARTLDSRATSVAVAGNTLLVSGAVWNPQRQRSEGMGLSAYSADGAKRFHLLGETSVPGLQILGRYGYIASNNNTRYTIIDPHRGVVLKRVSTPAITTLVDG